MTGTAPTQFSQTEISRFFEGRGIDAFVTAAMSTLTAPAGRHPRDILPSCRTIILFGIVMPDRFFSGTDTEQAEETRRLKESLESTAFALRDLLVETGAASETILPSLPLKVEEGKLRGRLSLKHCARDAGFGTLGENTLLIHPAYGNRLALAAVITEQEITPAPPPASLPVCTHCNRCVAACPEAAIHNGEVNIFACRNLADYVPRSFRTLSWRLMRGRWSARLVTLLLQLIGPHAGIRATCSACVTACPYFQIGKR